MTRTFLLRLWRIGLTAALFSSALFSYLSWQEAIGAGKIRETLAASSAMDAAGYASKCKEADTKLDVLLDALSSTEPLGRHIIDAWARHYDKGGATR